MLKEIKKQSPEIDITLVGFWQPWVMWKFREELESMGSDLSAAGIEGENCPWAVIPSRHFMYNVSLFPFLHSWASLLFRRVLNNRFDIVHCRGYFPSFIASELKQKFGYRLIFDMRSLWPKEHVTIGAWTTKDDIYRMWERIEKFTLETSDAAVGVSSPMVEEVECISPETKGTLIPICVDTREFYFDESARTVLRHELGWNGRRIIAYQGSLGLLNRNIYEVAEYFKFVLSVCPDVCFLILTSNRAVDIAQVMNNCGLDPSKYAVRYPQPGDLPKWLSVADAGIHAMSPGPDSHTRLGAKTVEYLSCGLPIIVNASVGAAAKLVETHGVGMVIDLYKREEAKRGLDWVLNRSELLREQCRKIAQDLFSVESCASKYIDLYRELSG